MGPDTGLAGVDRRDRIAWFSARNSFVPAHAKLLIRSKPFRRTTQTLVEAGPPAWQRIMPVFDNVTPFLSTPVIAPRAISLRVHEWIDDAFRAANRCSRFFARSSRFRSLANHIVDIECGYWREYMAWNQFGHAIDATLSHLVGYRILSSARNIYSGAFRLLHDWFRKPSNLGVAVELLRRVRRRLCGALNATHVLATPNGSRLGVRFMFIWNHPVIRMVRVGCPSDLQVAHERTTVISTLPSAPRS